MTLEMVTSAYHGESASLYPYDLHCDDLCFICMYKVPLHGLYNCFVI